jgi:uroporphyrinogen-III synthase
LVALSKNIGKEDVVRAIPVVAIGSGTAAEATRLGFTVAAEATSQGPGGLADAVVAGLRPAAVVG